MSDEKKYNDEREYHGWAVKSKEGRILVWSFSEKRTDLVQEILGVDYWRRGKRKGSKIVKVKLVEV